MALAGWQVRSNRGATRIRLRKGPGLTRSRTLVTDGAKQQRAVPIIKPSEGGRICRGLGLTE